MLTSYERFFKAMQNDNYERITIISENALYRHLCARWVFRYHGETEALVGC